MNELAHINADLLGLAPPAGRVLEIGCGEGLFAQAYRRINPLCHYVGIETAGSAASACSARVDRLLVGDVAIMPEADIAEGGLFDLIVLGASLDRVGDPAALLGKMKTLLADDGHILIDIRNIAHWSAFHELMLGRDPIGSRERSGDQAIRSLTLDALGAMLSEHGFRARKHRLQKDWSGHPIMTKWRSALVGLADTMGMDRRAIEDRCAIKSYAVLASGASDEPEMMYVTTAAFAPGGMDARARLPAEHLGSASAVQASYQEKAVRLPVLAPDMPKILVLQRVAPPDAKIWLQIIGPAIRQGWIVISEYDDHPELVAKVLNWSPERERWISLRAVHAVQTSTPALARVFGGHNPEVKSFANTAFTLPPLRERSGDPARIFYGATNRGDFSAALARSLAPVMAAHPDASFVVVHDKAFFDALPTDRKSFDPMLSYENYLARIETCDIALLPLGGSEYELYKSDMKYVESASRGAAVIASSAVYQHSVVHGETGLIAPGLDDWAPALKRLLSDEPLRQSIAANAWADIRAHRMFSTQIGERVGWYRQLWANREALQASLLAREPWIAGEV